MKSLVAALGVSLLAAAPTAASVFPSWSIELHLQSPTTYDCSDLDEVGFACADIASAQMVGAPHHQLWVLVTRVDTFHGIGGIQFGWGYDPELTGLVAGWTLCTGGSEDGTSPPQYPAWPTESGSGASIHWPGDCYDTIHNADGIVKVGFWDALPGPPACAWIQDDPRTGICLIAFCEVGAFVLPHLCMGTACLNQDDCTAHFVVYGNDCNKCYCEIPDPIGRTSWGAVKAMYK
jgi:hypothetical protein